MRSLLALALFGLVTFTTVMVVIYMRPYDRGALHNALAPPPPCPAPCLLGVRPRVTTWHAALAILKQHPWVKTVAIEPPDDSQDRTAWMRWTWSGAQPPWIDASARGEVMFVDHVAFRVAFKTHWRLGEVWPALGRPPLGNVFDDAARADTLIVLLAYPARQMMLVVRATCPAYAVWQTPVRFVSEALTSDARDPFDIPWRRGFADEFPSPLFTACRAVGRR